VRAVPAEAWHEAVREARQAGNGWLDWLGCVDEVGVTDELRVVLSLRNLDDPGRPELLLSCALPRDGARLDSIRDLFAGASWHERETAELFGVEFVGGDRRRLLLDPGFEGTPLRKDEVLAARTAQAWPGAKEPGEGDPGPATAGAASPSRRRMVPPGVPDAEVWGDRDATAPEPDPAEVAASAVGGRVRRRGRR
jgi:NADH-quinone oxidoreductase subunit C